VSVALPAATSLIALFFAPAFLDRWRERRQPFQFAWAPPTGASVGPGAPPR